MAEMREEMARYALSAEVLFVDAYPAGGYSVGLLLKDGSKLAIPCRNPSWTPPRRGQRVVLALEPMPEGDSP